MSGTIPLFSIITPVYNGARYLADLLDSVQAQAFTDYEHIIIDDGSTDNGATVAILEQYASADPRIRWWSQENIGAYPTQQEGLKAAQGDFLVIINADDIFVGDTVLQIVADFIAEHLQCDVFYGRTYRVSEDGKLLPQLDPHWRPSQWFIRQYGYIQHCSLFVSREMLHEKNVWLDLDYHYAADWDWIIRLFKASHCIGYLTEPLGGFRQHQGQRSRQSIAGMNSEVHQISARHGGYPRLNALIRKILLYRSMSLIALHTLRTQGLRALFKRIRRRSHTQKVT